ncbi:MAG: hypothetical protein JOZ74_01530 [Bradyrhizobium sp.]|nr:hypothetical protein [Bradyrhizobium sp.]
MKNLPGKLAGTLAALASPLAIAQSKITAAGGGWLCYLPTAPAKQSTTGMNAD